MTGTVARLRQVREPIARAVTAQFLERHPDWEARLGDSARLRGVEDALFHLDFLIGALLVQDDGAFRAYASWAARMLASRGIAPVYLAENLEQLAASVLSALGEVEGAEPARVLRLGAGEALVAPSTAAGDVVEPGSASKLFLSSAIMGDRRSASRIILDATRSEGSALGAYTTLEESLREVGRLWEIGRLTVAQEHMATAVAQYVMGDLRGRLPTDADPAGRVVITTPRGERHQVGAQMICDVLDADGWTVHFVGSDVPHEGVLQAVRDLKPDVVGLSAATLLSLDDLRDLVALLRALPDRPRIVVGGAVFRYRTGTWESLGADAVATSLEEARAVFARFRRPQSESGLKRR